jgi:hypothetical protein
MYSLEGLKELIQNTESMDSIEKKGWTELLPQMKEEHRQKLFEILDNERKQLDDLANNFLEL